MNNGIEANYITSKMFSVSAGNEYVLTRGRDIKLKYQNSGISYNTIEYCYDDPKRNNAVIVVMQETLTEDLSKVWVTTHAPNIASEPEPLPENIRRYLNRQEVKQKFDRKLQEKNI